MAALWTEGCLVDAALNAINDGFEVYPAIDCVVGTSPEALQLTVRRLLQAGGKPVSWLQLICELQRDWNREKTTPVLPTCSSLSRATDPARPGSFRHAMRSALEEIPLREMQVIGSSASGAD